MKTVIVGAGKVGFELARRLTGEGHDVVVIDNNEEALKEIKENLDVLSIHGNGASIKVLEKASIKETSLFIAVTKIDEVNIVACMMAKKAGIERTVARVRNLEYYGLKDWELSSQQLGIDLIINPEEAVAYDIFKILKTPTAREVEFFANGKVKMLGFRVQEDAFIANKRIEEIRLTSSTVAAILRKDEVLVPSGSTTIYPKDDIFIVSNADEPVGLAESTSKAIKKVVILGGGKIGMRLAQMIEERWPHGPLVKIIEHNPEVCKKLAEKLHRTLIINGDGTIPDILSEENIGLSDAFIAVTSQEQTNLLSGFMAKDMGAKKVIAELHRDSYIPLASKLGIDVTVIPRIIVASTILQLIREPNVASLSLVKEGSVEVIEIILSKDCKAANRAIRHWNFPEGAVVGAILREETVIVPRGDTIPLPGDHIIIFALPTVVPFIEKYFKERVQ
mgnify:CR=1 FL=1